MCSDNLKQLSFLDDCIHGDSLEMPREEIASRIKSLFGFDAKAKQVEAVYSLVSELRDTVLIAQTGFGKSVVFQVVPLLYPASRMALLIMPLLALQGEQARKMEAIDGCKPFVLDGDSNNAFNLDRIRGGSFTHVLTSPEIALSRQFTDRVLRHPEFYNRLCLLAIDELHLVEDWRDFRPEYAILGVLRTRLPESVPLLGVTATLDPSLSDQILFSCSFKENVAIIECPLNRPEIFLQVSVMKHPARSMKDLQHLLPVSVNSPRDIPKTVIFIDSVPMVLQAYRLIKGWMRALCYPGDVNRLVQPFFSAMADRDKRKITADFDVLSDELIGPRIVVSTEAYGLGMDNPDICRIIQWGVPATMSRMYQRMGRAMRSGGKQAYFLLLYPPSMVGPLEVPPGANKKKRADIESRAKLPISLWRMMNEKQPVCLRKIGLEYFKAIDLRSLPEETDFSCCSNCNEDLTTSTGSHDTLNVILDKNSLRKPWFEKQFEQWRKDKASRLITGSGLSIHACIMPNSVLHHLASHGDQIQTLAMLYSAVGSGWADLAMYQHEVFAILTLGQSLPQESGEVFEAWVTANDIQRKRVVAPSEDDRMKEFHDRRLMWLEMQPSHKPTAKLGNTKRKKDGIKIVHDIPGSQPIADLEKIKTAVVVPSNNKENDKSMHVEKRHSVVKRRKRAGAKPSAPEHSIITVLGPSRSRVNRKMPSRYEN